MGSNFDNLMTIGIGMTTTKGTNANALLVRFLDVAARGPVNRLVQAVGESDQRCVALALLQRTHD